MPLTLSPTQIAFNARGDGSFHRPFAEQVAFLRDKLDLPTEHWDDLLKGAHDRAFVVAGAMKADLLADFHAAVLKTAAEGKSLQWFKKEFEAIVAQNGWQGWTGEDTPQGRDWRARVIYRTNLTASHAAGRYAQLTDPELLKVRPFWKYVHNDTVTHPRDLHQAWGRKPVVLRHDDPWWQTHFPPNGWGCRCRVVAVREEEYPGDPPPNDGEWTKTDRNGDPHVIPKGIDYGWDYAPGASLQPRQLSQKVMDEWRAAKADAWETLTRGGWQSLGRPAAIPVDATTIAPGPRLSTQAQVIDALRSLLGGESKVYRVGGDYAYPLMVDAEALGSHIDPARSVYLPYLETLIQEPFEVWAMIQQHKGTGQTAFRVRLVKRIETGDKKGLLLVAQAYKGQLESWTFMPTSDLKYLNRQREGVLVYARE